jgi:hypothetical protein
MSNPPEPGAEQGGQHTVLLPWSLFAYLLQLSCHHVDEALLLEIEHTRIGFLNDYKDRGN